MYGVRPFAAVPLTAQLRTADGDSKMRAGCRSRSGLFRAIGLCAHTTSFCVAETFGDLAGIRSSPRHGYAVRRDVSVGVGWLTDSSVSGGG